MINKLRNLAVRCLLALCFGSRSRTKQPIGVRHVQMVLLFFGLVLSYAMRVNMSMAIVAMTDPSEETMFFWTMRTQSVILSSFFWGYIVLQVPGGELANRVGAKVLLASAVGVNSAVVLLIPFCANYGDWKLVCVCRMVQGLAQGVIFPSVHNLIGKWVPIEEKNRLGTFTYAGTHLGTALQLTTAGYIADRWGWPNIFYSVGVLGVMWTGFYVYLGSSSPQTSSIISDEEKEYIQNSLGTTDTSKRLQTPWSSILTSKPFLALTLVHCGHNWGFWTLLAEMPSYMKLVVGLDIKSNGVLTALPYLAMYLLSFPFGIIVDYSSKNNLLSLSASRKLSNSIGLYGAAAALVGLCFVPPSDVNLTVAVLVVAVAVNAGHLTGFLLVHIDMAPNFAGTMMGITNFAANIVSIVAPLVAGVILREEMNPVEWYTIFCIAAGVYIVTNTVFIMYGTSERQPWNEPEDCRNLMHGANEKKALKVV